MYVELGVRAKDEKLRSGQTGKVFEKLCGGSRAHQATPRFG